MHTRPVELVAQRSEDLELDPVLGTAGGALHPDQVLQRCDPDDQAISKLDRLSMRLEVIEIRICRRECRGCPGQPLSVVKVKASRFPQRCIDASSTFVLVLMGPTARCIFDAAKPQRHSERQDTGASLQLRAVGGLSVRTHKDDH